MGKSTTVLILFRSSRFRNIKKKQDMNKHLQAIIKKNSSTINDLEQF